AEQVESFLNTAYAAPQNLASVIAASIEQSKPSEDTVDMGTGDTATPTLNNVVLGASSALSRNQLHLMIQATLAGQPQINALYSMFESNAFDGRDADYTSGFAHSTPEGVLESYFIRNGEGGVEAVPAVDATAKYKDTLNELGVRESEWYLCAKDTLKPCALEPYLYEVEPGKVEMMTSLTFPIVVDGEFAGV